MRSGFTKRTVIDTRQQLKDLAQLTPIKVHVTGTSPKGYLVRVGGRIAVPCSKRGEVHAVLEMLKDIAVTGRLAPMNEGISPQKANELIERDRQSQETVYKMIEYINIQKPLMALAAIETGPDAQHIDEIDLITQSNTRILAKFSSWYKCLIYLKGMVEVISAPIPKF